MFTLRIIIISIFVNCWSENFNVVSVKAGPSSSTTSVVERFENIIKSPNDKRSYRGLRLANEMKIMLVSDPLAEKSVAAMVVGVGFLNDFRDVPGVANLVGYMLMAGSRQHTQVFDFHPFVQAHGGHVELACRADDQVFSFNVNPKHFVEALNRFSEFFVEPLVSYGYSEILLDTAVRMLQRKSDSYAQNERFRILEAEKLASKKNHAHYHFHHGSENTLYQHAKDIPDGEKKTFPDPKKKSLIDKAHQFHSMWYSSNIMTLVVLANERLDKLEEMVLPLFKKVKNKSVKKIIYPYKHHPWGPEQMKKKIYVEPIFDSSQLLRINFAIPDVRCQYMTAPHAYLTRLMTDEGQGSLLAILRKRELCKELTVEALSTAGFGFFAVNCEFTNKHIELVDDVVTLIFQYIRLLRDRGIQQYIFDDLQKIEEIRFKKYRPEDNEQPLSYAQIIATYLQNYHFEVALPHDYLQRQWEPEPIKKFLTYLRPDNMNITIASKSVAKKANQEEEYYKVKYEIEAIDDELIEKWKSVEHYPEFQLPPVNEFIPKNFHLYPLETQESKRPHLIHKSSISEIWFKQDHFNAPELYIAFELFSGAASFSPFECSLWHLFCNLFTPFLKEYLYPSHLVGFDVIAIIEDTGMLITLYGFNDTLPIVLEKVLSQMNNFEHNINDENFNTVLKKYIRTFSHSIEGDPLFQIDWYAHHSQTQNNWTVYESLEAAKTLQYSNMKIFLRKIFRRIFIRGFVHGNCTKKHALDIANTIEKQFHASNGMLAQEILWPRYVELKNGSHFIYQTFSDRHDIYGYYAYFQYNTRPSSFYTVAALLLHAVTERPCRKILPQQTQNQDTTTICKLLRKHGTRGFSIRVLTKKDPRTMDARVEKFIRDIPQILKNTSYQDFEKFKLQVEANEYAKPTQLVTLSTLLWREIRSRQYHFDKSESELKKLRSLKKQDLLDFFKELLEVSSPRRRKLSIHVFPKAIKRTKPALVNEIPAGAIEFTELSDFQSNLNLLPITANLPI